METCPSSPMISLMVGPGRAGPPATPASIYNLGLLLKARGELDEAEPLYREVLTGAREVLGPKHPNTLTSVNNLGSLLQDRGDLDKAAPLMVDALAGLRATLGDTPPGTPTANCVDMTLKDPLHIGVIEHKKGIDYSFKKDHFQPWSWRQMLAALTPAAMVQHLAFMKCQLGQMSARRRLALK